MLVPGAEPSGVVGAVVVGPVAVKGSSEAAEVGRLEGADVGVADSVVACCADVTATAVPPPTRARASTPIAADVATLVRIQFIGVTMTTPL